ncbi:Trans-enoyl reductase ACTTS2-like protein [Elsinoe fawcettii]|nr:Trans-enoyl reductase ACTTS2-like protein [Elsinoe fawcettii]
MSVPSQIKALKSTSNRVAELRTVPTPKLRDDYVLAKVHAVALNPTDWKHVAWMPAEGATVGCDFAGTVVQVGSKVTKSLKPGDRITGFAHGVNSVEPEDGTFAEYAVMKGDLATKIPDSLSFEDASTLGVGVSTVGQGLYQSLKLHLPGEGDGKGEYVLVYGGSTATGTLAIQYAKLSGYKVLSTNSPHNDELVKSLGAEKSFNYKDADAGKQIREYTGGKLSKVFDTISEGDSPAISAEAIGDNGGKISFLLQVGRDKVPNEKIEIQTTLAYSVTGEGFKFGPQAIEFPPNPADFEFAKKFWGLTEKLLAEGKIKTHPADKRGGGIEKITEGLKDLQEGRVSGKKIVYTLA